jgi:hypothetical protein
MRIVPSVPEFLEFIVCATHLRHRSIRYPVGRTIEKTNLSCEKLFHNEANG